MWRLHEGKVVVQKVIPESVMEERKDNMGNYKILAINPGSTSTKVAVFQGTEKLLSENVSHAAEDLENMPRCQISCSFVIK